MVYYINFVLTNLLIDLLVAFSLKRFFKLKASGFMLVALQILNIILSFLYLYCNVAFYQFILMKIGVSFVISILIADEIKIKPILSIFSLGVVLLFSIFGFFEFMLLLIRCSLDEFFGLKLSNLYDFLIIFCLFLYIFFLFLFMRYLANQKISKNYLQKVSFLLAGRHIEIIGLLDSGNSLIDKATGKPVVVVSLKSLENYFSFEEYERITKGDLSPLGITHRTSFVTANEKTSFMPITDVGSIVIESEDENKVERCVLGFVEQNFKREGGFDCLLHKDFI